MSKIPIEFMGIELSTEEYKEKRIADTHKDANEALSLFNHPMVQGFLEKERAGALRAFKKLPMESGHEKYMALKIYYNVLDDFEKRLKSYETAWNNEQIKQEIQRQ